MRRIVYTLFTLAFGVCLIAAALPQSVLAAKPRVRKTVGVSRTKTRAKATGVSYSSVRLSRATNSVVINFLNMDKMTKASYLLNYTANGIPQGVGGAIVPNGGTTDSRDLYFGTCSKGVCTPHYNITNASLTVTTTLSSGATYAKRYRIKV